MPHASWLLRPFDVAGVTACALVVSQVTGG
jgi:hypothetical protein